MSALARRKLLLTKPPTAGLPSSSCPSSSSSSSSSSSPLAFQYGRSPAYRRIAALHSRTSPHSSSSVAFQSHPSLSSTLRLYTPFFPSTLRQSASSPIYRALHTSTQRWQEQRQDEHKDQKAKASSDDKEESTKDEKPDEEETTKDEKSGDGKDGKKKAEEDAPPPPHGDKSPWQVFTETLQSEFKASKEWNESTKALGSAAHDFTQNPRVQAMRKNYEVASGAASTTTAKVLKNTGKAVGQSAAWTWDTAPVRGVRASVNAVGRGLEKTTRPIRETEAYKSVANVIDDGSSSRYGGWTEREERRQKRENREAEEFKRTGRVGRVEKMEEDPDAGTNITVHKDAAWKESWRTFRENSPVFERLNSWKATYAESENPLISTARSISDRVAGFFAENETAAVIKAFRGMDPTFQLEPFLQDMREYILPEVLDAYVKGDLEVLKMWLSDAQFQVYSALMRQYTTHGLKSDGKILDIRHVDILSARILDPGDIPVFIVTARTQEVHVYKDAKTGNLAAGMEDRVQQVTYAIGVTRIPDEVNNGETRGWRIIELQKSARG